MDMAGLSLDQAPPYGSIQRFFITAPVFALLASAVIIFDGSHLFYSFLNNKLIGILHWMTLGFITMSMFGAVLQMLPVLAGVKIQNPVVFSAAVHASLVPGAFLFGFSYVFQFKGLLLIAGILIAFSALLFSVRIFYKLAAVKTVSHTISSMRISIGSLMVVLMLGLYMLAWKLNLLKGAGVDVLSVHFLWAFYGWIGILIMGVSFQVIPMFYVSPEYPAAFRKVVPIGIFVLLIIYTLATFLAPVFSAGILPGVAVRKTVRIILYSFSALYAVITLRQILSRKRKLPDPSLLFWKTGMVFLLISSTLAAALEFYKGAYFSKMILLTGMIFILGFIFSVINGMMYKIVPFLSWFHLAGKGIFDVPTMKEMLDDVRVKIQFVFHFLLLLTLPLPLFFPRWGHLVTGIFLFTSSAILWANLFTVIRTYNVIKNKHLAALNNPI